LFKKDTCQRQPYELISLAILLREFITEANQENSPGLRAERQFTPPPTENLADIEWTNPSSKNGFVE